MRNKIIWTILVLILIVFSVLIYFDYQSYRTPFVPHESSPIGGMTWHNSLDKALQIAQKENKPVAVYFSAIWCQGCAKFQSYTLVNTHVKKMLEENYVLVEMDLDINIDVSRNYNVGYPPYLLLLDKDGTVLES